MFDIRWVRDNAAAFDAGLRKRGLALGKDVSSAAQLIALDEARRKIVTRLQEAQARRNAASKEVGKAKGAKDEAAAGKLMAEMAALKDELVKGAEEQRRAPTKKATRRCGVLVYRPASSGRMSPSSTSRSAKPSD